MRLMPWFVALIASPALAQVPMVGGWSTIARPAGDAQVRAAAAAVMAQMPAGHRRLRRIETAEQQVVAGMNYRLMLRLSDRSHWHAVVWHKLDGTYDVTESAPGR